MLINPEEKRDLKKTNKRLFIFLAIVFLLDGFFCFLLYKYVPNIHPVLNGFIIIVITTVLYILFMWLCSAIDKRKAKRLAESGKRDPFLKEESVPDADKIEELRKAHKEKKEQEKQNKKKNKKNKILKSKQFDKQEDIAKEVSQAETPNENVPADKEQKN